MRTPITKALRDTRSSVLVIVMITILFTVVALTAFIERASNDLLVESRAYTAARLRQDAYSALEVTVAVLEDFRQADSGLHSPNEGWSDPLTWAGYTPPNDEVVTVTFTDESGKISLPHADLTTLTNLFEAWQMSNSDAQNLADAVIGWQKKGYVYSTALTTDYDQAAIPFDSPSRPMRSWSELQAIDVVKTTFFDDQGRPNDKWWRFVADCSLYNFPKPNINGANADVLAAVGQFTDIQAGKVSDYLAGNSSWSQGKEGPTWFQNASMATTVAGPGTNTGNFATTISALRVHINVKQGTTSYDLETVIAPTGGATLVTTTATSPDSKTSTSQTSSASPSATGGGTSQTTPSATANNTQASAANTANTNLKYPYTLLEIRENDAILVAPPPPPPTQP